MLIIDRDSVSFGLQESVAQLLVLESGTRGIREFDRDCLVPP